MDDIPPLLPPDQIPPIRTADDLHLHWRRLMGELGFGTRCLWVTLLDPLDLVMPSLTRIEDLPERPPQRVVQSLVRATAEGLGCPGSGWSVGFLLSRPGPTSVTSSDLGYRDVLTSAARTHRLTVRPMFLATSAAVVGLDVAEAA